jgi:hypothetical protein
VIDLAELAKDLDEASAVADVHAGVRRALAAGRTLLAALEEAQRERGEMKARCEKWLRDWTQLRREHETAISAWAHTEHERDAARADAERMRQELADAGWHSIPALHAAYVDVLERWQRGEPVVEAALDFSRNQSRLWPLMDAAGKYRAATQAAVDTYEGGNLPIYDEDGNMHDPGDAELYPHLTKEEGS